MRGDAPAGPAERSPGIPIDGTTGADTPPLPRPASDESPLAATLRRLHRDRRTGVVRVGDDGAFHLADGTITFAESRYTAGFDLQAAMPEVPGGREPSPAGPGRIAGERPGSPAPDPDRLPEGARARLEMCALLATFDAAYFLLHSRAAPEFTEGPPHRLARACRISAPALLHECERRRLRPAGEWPAELVDRAPVVPVRRVRRQRLFLTGLQAEILLNADGRRTLVDLAHDLGRTTFGCLEAVRRLTAASLVRPPSGGPSALPVRRRRRPPAPAGEESDASAPLRWTPVDIEVLVQLRAALEKLP